MSNKKIYGDQMNSRENKIDEIETLQKFIELLHLDMKVTYLSDEKAKYIFAEVLKSITNGKRVN